MANNKKTISNKKNIIIIVVSIVVLLSLVFLIMSNNWFAKDIVINQEGEYPKLFQNKQTMLVYQYGTSSEYTLKEITNVINKINTLFAINILVADKDGITRDDLATVNKEIIYDQWQKTNELIYIKDGKLNKQQDIGNYFSLNEVENYICTMISDTKIVKESRLNKLMKWISVDDYLNKQKENNKFYLLLGRDIYKTVFVIYTFDKRKLDFNYINYENLSSDDIDKLIDSNIKYDNVIEDANAISYVVSSRRVEFQPTTNSITEVENFISKTSTLPDEEEPNDEEPNGEEPNGEEPNVEEPGTTVPGAVNITSEEATAMKPKFMNQVKMLHFPSATVLDFLAYNNYKVKAKMVLDKLEYIDFDITEDENGRVTISKEEFDTRTSMLFGNDTVIDISNLGKIQSGDSCANWEYNSSNKVFIRGSLNCTNDNSKIRRIVTDKHKTQGNKYIIETKEAYIDKTNNKVYADNQYKKQVGTISNGASNEAIDNYLKTITNKLYTYRYTFHKITTGFYLKSFEIKK